MLTDKKKSIQTLFWGLRLITNLRFPIGILGYYKYMAWSWWNSKYRVLKTPQKRDDEQFSSKKFPKHLNNNLSQEAIDFTQN